MCKLLLSIPSLLLIACEPTIQLSRSGEIYRCEGKDQVDAYMRLYTAATNIQNQNLTKLTLAGDNQEYAENLMHLTTQADISSKGAVCNKYLEVISCTFPDHCVPTGRYQKVEFK